mmetsp:Transcript_89215/g.170998  ORF Transcript_89215/g.170998 Transcript_89215/m.170998 type:complete len:173 (+) Transcript_89215:1051-1569(+)
MCLAAHCMQLCARKSETKEPPAPPKGTRLKLPAFDGASPSARFKPELLLGTGDVPSPDSSGGFSPPKPGNDPSESGKPVLRSFRGRSSAPTFVTEAVEFAEESKLEAEPGTFEDRGKLALLSCDSSDLTQAPRSDLGPVGTGGRLIPALEPSPNPKDGADPSPILSSEDSHA